MKTAAGKNDAAWEWLRESPSQVEDLPPETSAPPRSRIRRRVEAMLVNMLGDEADRPPEPEPQQSAVLDGRRSRHGMPGLPDTPKRSRRPSAPRHASN